MALTHYQVGAIVSGCSGAMLLIIILMLVFVHPVRRFTFSHQKFVSPIPISTIRDEENQRPSTSSNLLSDISPFEIIGNLTISPGRRPLPSALDIVNHVGTAIGLPAGAKLARLQGVPRISLHLPPPTPISPATKVNIAMTEAEARSGSLHTKCTATSIRVISLQVPLGHREAAAQERKAKDEAHVFSLRADSVVATEKYGFDLGLATSSVEQLEEGQDDFFIGCDDDGLDDIQSADHELANGFGSGKAMAALYHAV